MMRSILVLVLGMATTAPAAEFGKALLSWFEGHDAVDAVLDHWRAPGETVVSIDSHAYRIDADNIYWDSAGIAWRALYATTTAYSPCREECDDDPDRTAIGAPAFETYGIAADPRAISYRSVLRVPGYGEAMVDDTGSAMRRSWTRGVLQLDLRIPRRGTDGRWRSESECRRIARAHGVQSDCLVLLRIDRPDSH